MSHHLTSGPASSALACSTRRTSPRVPAGASRAIGVRPARLPSAHPPPLPPVAPRGWGLRSRGAFGAAAEGALVALVLTSLCLGCLLCLAAPPGGY